MCSRKPTVQWRIGVLPHVLANSIEICITTVDGLTSVSAVQEVVLINAGGTQHRYAGVYQRLRQHLCSDDLRASLSQGILTGLGRSDQGFVVFERLNRPGGTLRWWTWHIG